MFCSKCGKELSVGSAFCAGCGEPVTVGESSIPAPGVKSAQTLSTLAIVFGVVGLFLLPYIFGLAAVILAIIAKSKKERLATRALGISIASFVFGTIWTILYVLKVLSS